ncbi:MAG: protein kinase [Polyangiaceae bacterium]|nr:protein kinase [Polyangiaceae bacterium]
MNAENPPRFGPYELVDRIAMGGMAEVFLARREGARGFQKLVAVKRILPQYSADQDFVAMFVDEARVSAQLSHPNIVQVFDFGEVEGGLYMAMEYVQGTTVSKLVRGAHKKGFQVPLEVTLHVITSVLRGLDHAHRAVDEDGEPLNIIHRDVSPGNILVDVAGAVKLTDFGIARAREIERRTDVGQLKGKLGYMSPEQVLGLDLDPRSDLFTVGIILAEMLILKPLFYGPKDLDILMKIRDVDLTVLDNATIDPDMRRILYRSLAKRREARFSSAAEFVEALEEVIRLRRLQVVPSQLSVFVAKLAGTLASEPKVQAVSPREERRTKLENNDASYRVERAADEVGSNSTDVGPLSFAQMVELVATGQVSPKDRVAKGDGPFITAEEFPEFVDFLGTASVRWDEKPAVLKPIDRIDLSTFLFQAAADRMTGALMVIHGSRRKKVFIAQGAPEFILSTIKDELLGEHLVRKGRVVRMEIDMALAMLPKFRGRLGDTLVGLGVLRPVELFRTIQEQLEERFVEVFQWREGKYGFSIGERCAEETFPPGVEPIELVVRGIRSGFSEAEISAYLDPLKDEVLVHGSAASLPRVSLRLQEREEYVLRRIDQKRTVKDIVQLLVERRFTVAEAERALFLGLVSGTVTSEKWDALHPGAAKMRTPSSSSRLSSLPPETKH